jgi:hypothetical protein
MSVFEFFSEENNCEETEEYLNSLANHFEKVLKKELGIDVEKETNDVLEQAMILSAYIVFNHFSGKKNPNVDTDCELQLGRVGPSRLQKWAAAAETEESESQLREAGVKAITTGYRKARDFPYILIMDRLDDMDKSEVVTSLGRPFLNLAKMRDAEVRFFKAVDEHDEEGPYQKWIHKVMSFDGVELYARRIAEEVNKCIRRLEITVEEGNQKEIVTGMIYLSCIPHLKYEEVSPQPAVLIELRTLLVSSIPPEYGHIDAEQYILTEWSKNGEITDEIIDAISLWAASYNVAETYRPSTSKWHKLDIKYSWNNFTKKVISLTREAVMDVEAP